MSRPRSPLGTYGEINSFRDGERWVARSRYMDYDGVRRQVQKTGATKDAAVRALRAALRDRKGGPGAGDLTPNDRLSAAAEAWWAEDVIAAGRLALSTVDQYGRIYRNYLVPGIGALKVKELTVGSATRWLRTVEEKHGAPTAKLCRSVLAGVAGYCTRRDLLPQNPIRDTAAITVKSTAKRALTVREVKQLRARLAADPKAVARDLPELVGVMLATGVRLSEAAAFRPNDLHMWRERETELDDDARSRIEVSGSVVRVTGRGVVRQEVRDENSKLHVRALRLPQWAVEMLIARLERMVEAGTLDADGPLFPAPKGGWRDRSNTERDLRDALNAAGFSWVTSHTFRRTVATRADRAGLSATAGAAQLGHRRPSMTQDNYHDRTFVDTGVADVLEDFGD